MTTTATTALFYAASVEASGVYHFGSERERADWIGEKPELRFALDERQVDPDVRKLAEASYAAARRMETHDASQVCDSCSEPLWAGDDEHGCHSCGHRVEVVIYSDHEGQGHERHVRWLERQYALTSHEAELEALRRYERHEHERTRWGVSDELLDSLHESCDPGEACGRVHLPECERFECGHVDSDVDSWMMHGGMTPFDAEAIFDALLHALGHLSTERCYACHEADYDSDVDESDSRTVAHERAEDDECERGTLGCCIDHGLDSGSCETW